MKYKILNAAFALNLEMEVNEYLEKGWDIHGDMKIFTYTDQNGVSYPDFFQAIIKHEPVVNAQRKRPIPAF